VTPTARRVVLHAGLPKSGSSALQHWCQTNRALLSDHGVRYPAADPLSLYPNHQYLVRGLFSGDLTPVAAELSHADNPDTLLLSTEGLSNHVHNFDARHLEALRLLFGGAEIVVFVVLREPEGWLKSCYKQSLINPPVVSFHYATTLGLDEYARLERTQRLLRHETLLPALAAAYGAKVVSAAFAGDWGAAFAGLLGLPAGTDITLPRENTSVPDWLAELVRQANGFGLEPEQRLAWLALCQAVAGTGSTLLQDIARTQALGRPAVRVDPALLDRLTARGWCSAEQLSQFRDRARQRLAAAPADGATPL